VNSSAQSVSVKKKNPGSSNSLFKWNRPKKLINPFYCMLVVAIVTVFISTGAAIAGPLSGAIFTTTVNGDVVNGNVIYEFKEDVYLDGGPGPNAPASAAGLPEGDYYFQVTDPSGKDLLSTDHISCRKVHVNSSGVIDTVYPGINHVKQQGKWQSVPCQHAQGVDIDHIELGAITVQLFPYDDTPNPGGVYKAWMTPVANFAGNPNVRPADGSTGSFNVNGENWQPANVHGFIPSWSKTDNYKVDKKGRPFDPPLLTIFKFHDRNFNGVLDAGEEGIAGWAMDVTDTLNITSTVFTQAGGFTNDILTAEAGIYTVVEETPAGTLQTVSELDGVQLSLIPTANPTVLVTVAGDSGETHLVVYGNVGLGAVKACKIFDRDGDGVADLDEPGIPGWKIQLSDASGLLDEKLTGADGCATFSDLLPGTYTVTEVIPATGGWFATGPTSESVTIESSLSGGVLHGTLENSSFTNVCTDTADFGTKGFWHNKNGLTLLNDHLYVIDELNLLAPYVAASSYFDDGDEPFDGMFGDGTPVAAAHGPAGEFLAAAGTTLAEVSQFLVDPNAGGDPREQLAQQLAAFYFNVRIYLGGTAALIQLPDGSFVSAQSLIDAAIAAWLGTDASAQTAIKTTLDTFNNNDAVVFVPGAPCPVVYP